MNAFVAEIFALYRRFAAEQYGEDITIVRHMLQTAVQARAEGAADPVVAAALLHDIGYFVENDSRQPHETVGAAWLSRAYGEDVTLPIAMHVDAKRYLCAVDPGYFDLLSEASRISLAAQGGPMTSEEAAQFARSPAADAAILLRRCDDRGKDLVKETPPLESFTDLLVATQRHRA